MHQHRMCKFSHTSHTSGKYLASSQSLFVVCVSGGCGGVAGNTALTRGGLLTEGQGLGYRKGPGTRQGMYVEIWLARWLFCLGGYFANHD